LNFSEDEEVTRDVLNETQTLMSLLKSIASQEAKTRSQKSVEEGRDIREASLVGDIFVQLLQQFTTFGGSGGNKHERSVLKAWLTNPPPPQFQAVTSENW